DIITKITELVVSPFILPLSRENHNEKTQLIEEAIMKFDVTIIEDNNDISNIWKEVDSDHDFESSVLKNFETTHGELSDEQISKFLWDLGKVPLIVQVENPNKDLVVHI